MDVLGQRSAPGGVTTPALAVARRIAHAREVRGLGRVHGSSYARPRDPEPIKHKPAWKGGSAYPARPGKLEVWQLRASLTSPNFASPVLATGEVYPGKSLPGGLRCNPGGPFAPIRP